MNIEDFDNLKSLLKGFRQENGKKICIYCENAVGDEELIAHEESHGRDEKFETLLHADSVFSFTAKEKVYLQYVFSGYKDKEIAREMGIPEVSARRMRNQFNGRLREAAGFLAMADLLGDKLKRQKRAQPVQSGIEMPVINEKGKVVDFYETKRQLHKSGALHATTIIVVVKRDPETGEPAFLVVDKADKKMTVEGTGFIPCAADFLGGHVRVCDWPETMAKRIPEDLLGQHLPLKEVMWNCARRELAFEFVSPMQDADTLSFWFEDRYKGEHTEGINNELTWVFLCPYKGTLNQLNVPGEVRIKDDWIDSIGQRVTRTYVGRFQKLSDIEAELEKPNLNAYDGFMRVMQNLKNNKELMEILKAQMNSRQR